MLLDHIQWRLMKSVCSQTFCFAGVAAAPDSETPFIYYPELHFDAARWEACSPLRLVESAWATPQTPAAKKEKESSFLLLQLRICSLPCTPNA